MNTDECVQAAVRMQRQCPARDGWSWHAAPVEAAPGWFRLHEQGPTGERLRGGLTYLGPGDVVLEVSANPLIHDPAVTEAVLAELGGARPGRLRLLGRRPGRLGAQDLAAEILRRTREAESS